MTQSIVANKNKCPDSENESDAEDSNENSNDDKALDSDEEVNKNNWLVSDIASLFTRLIRMIPDN